MTLLEQVVESIREAASGPVPSSVTEDSVLDNCGLDSLDQVELRMILEDRFDIEIPEEDVDEKIVTVGDIIRYLGDKGITEMAETIV